MKVKDIFDKQSFSNLENQEEPENPFGYSPFESVGKGKIKALKEAIDEINFLIEQREELSKTLSNDVEKIKNEIENFLLKTEAVDSEGFKERSGLRQKQIEVSELQLNERVNCWRDVALLKKELREKQKELSEKQKRAEMLGKILEDRE